MQYAETNQVTELSLTNFVNDCIDAVDAREAVMGPWQIYARPSYVTMPITSS